MSTQSELNRNAIDRANAATTPSKWWTTTLLGGSSFTTLGGQRGAFAFTDHTPLIPPTVAAPPQVKSDQAPVIAEQALPVVPEEDQADLNPEMWPIGQSADTVAAGTQAVVCAAEEPASREESPAPTDSVETAESQRILRNLSRRFAFSPQRPAAPSGLDTAPPSETATESTHASAAKPHGYHVAVKSESHPMEVPPATPPPASEALLPERRSIPSLDGLGFDNQEPRLKDYTLGFGELMRQSLPELPPTFHTSSSIAPPTSQEPRAISGYYVAHTEPASAADDEEDELQLLAAPPRARPVAYTRVPNPNRKRKSWLSWLSTPPPPDAWE
jgi:hypothetical protein